MALGGKRRGRDQEAQTAAWQTARERVQWFLTRAETFTGVVNNEDPTIPVQLRPGEHALLVLPTSVLVEPHHPAAHWTGGVSGYSFQVARGNHYQGGAAKGAEPAQGADDPVALDTGTATVTDSRVVFVGARTGYEWEYDKVLGFSHAEDPPWTAIAVAGGTKLTGLRYDPSHIEAFRFSLTLGLARFHGAVDSLVEDLRKQLNEIDAERPGGVAAQSTAPFSADPALLQTTTPSPLAESAPLQPVAVQPAPVAVQPAPVAVTPAPVAVTPAPVAVTPAPVAVQPAPVAVQPAPVAVTPAPVAVQPAPVAPAPIETAPEVAQPAPVQPVSVQPVSVQPVAVQPEPVAVQPVTPSVSTEPVAPKPAAVQVEPLSPETTKAESAAPQHAETAPSGSADSSESSPLPAPGWYHDPYGSAQARWWDGQQWTANTA